MVALQQTSLRSVIITSSDLGSLHLTLTKTTICEDKTVAFELIDTMSSGIILFLLNYSRLLCLC